MMFTQEPKLVQVCVVLLLSPLWSAAVAAEGIDLPYSDSVSEYGPAFEIENKYQEQLYPPGSPLAGPTDLEPLSAILGRYSFTGTPVIEVGTGKDLTSKYQNMGRLGGHTSGVEGICGTRSGYGVRAVNNAEGGTGLYAIGGTNGFAGLFEGDIVLQAPSSDPGDIIFQTSVGTQKARIWSEPSGASGLHLSSGDNVPDLTIHPNGTVAVTGNLGIGTWNTGAKLHVEGDAVIKGNLRIVSPTHGLDLIELGEGLDYAEGFDVSGSCDVGPGSVLVIDPENPGHLTVSTIAYDTKVAGIVAGARGLRSGVRLGLGRFDKDVALAGRVYCNVDASEASVQPGDLLTTSARQGYAMKASDYVRAHGAVLGKAMENLEQGKRGQILVLVTLQ